MVKNKNNAKQNARDSEKETDISEMTEAVFKKILRTMSWIVGCCFILIIILPLFESDLLDDITKILFFIGAFNLIAFTIIEFVSDSIKQKIQKIIQQSS